MKVLLVTDFYPPGRTSGVGQVVRSLHDEYKKISIKSKVLTTGEININQADIISHSKNLYVGNFINNFVLLKYCLANRYDIFHLHQSLCTLFLPIFRFLKLVGLTRTSVVNTLHVDYISEFKFVKPEITTDFTIRPANKEVLKKYLFYPVHALIDLVGYYSADIITVLSVQNKLDIEKHYGFIYKRESKIIPNGFDSKNFDFTKKSFNSDTINFIYTGSFRARKRITRIIELLSETQKRTKKKLSLLLIGNGTDEYENKLKKYIELRNFQDKVTFVGNKKNSELEPYYKKGHFFIITSSYEGFPVSILEAIGSGLIVVTQPHYGAKDMLSDQSAFMMENRIEETADRLSILLLNETEMNSIQAEAHRLVKNKYKIDNIAKRYIELYHATSTKK